MSDEIKVTIVERSGRCVEMRYTDPITGKTVAKSSGTRDRDKAIGKAAVWQDELNSGRYKPSSKITWKEFREKYEAQRVATMAETGRRSVTSAFNHLERVLNPDRLRRLSTPVISHFIAELRKPRIVKLANGKEKTLRPIREATIASYLRSIKAALRWAERMGLLVVVPRFDMPDAGEAKGRGLSGEEFDRLLAAVQKLRPKDAAQWQRLLVGLWLSGLRLGESMALSWEPDAPFAVDLSGKFPAFQIDRRAQKGRRTERVPMTPDFSTWLLKTPKDDRHGRVFKLVSLRDGQPIHSEHKTGEMLCKIGEAARIVVNKDPDTGKVKYASAHDLRRSFGSRWAKKVMPAVLQKLMRHADVATTMKYYVQLGADDVASELWAKFPGSGDTFGDNHPESTPAADRKSGEASTEAVATKGDWDATV